MVDKLAELKEQLAVWQAYAGYCRRCALDAGGKTLAFEEFQQRLQIGFWQLDMLYEHIGLGPKFADLGQVQAADASAALAEANKRATAYVRDFLDEKEVGEYKVKARPCDPTGTPTRRKES